MKGGSESTGLDLALPRPRPHPAPGPWVCSLRSQGPAPRPDPSGLRQPTAPRSFSTESTQTLGCSGPPHADPALGRRTQPREDLPAHLPAGHKAQTGAAPLPPACHCPSVSCPSPTRAAPSCLRACSSSNPGYPCSSPMPGPTLGGSHLLTPAPRAPDQPHLSSQLMPCTPSRQLISGLLPSAGGAQVP